jgi:flagellin-like hook-associated protein FlgL
MGDNYIFSGHQTDTPPYAHHLEISAGSADALSFGLAADAAETTVQIRNAAGVLVRTLTLGDGSTAGSGGSAGENTVAWDGLDDGGAALPDGVYTFGLAAVDGAIRVADYATYNGDAGDHRLVMGDRLGLVIHADGERIFGDLFQVLGRLEQALEDPDQIAGGNVIQSLIGPLHDAADRLEHTRAEGAVKFKHLQLTEDHYAGLKLKVEEMLYDTEKADMATAIVELQQLQSAYETTLATAARILQPSLINFLK